MGRLDCMSSGQRHSREIQKATLHRQPIGQLNGKTDSPAERDNLLFFQMMMMRWDCCWWQWLGEDHSETTDPCRSKWVLRTFLFALRFYSHIWPWDLLPQSGEKRGGSPHINQVKRSGGPDSDPLPEPCYQYRLWPMYSSLNLCTNLDSDLCPKASCSAQTLTFCSLNCLTS